MGNLPHDAQALIVTNTESRWDKVVWYYPLTDKDFDVITKIDVNVQSYRCWNGFQAIWLLMNDVREANSVLLSIRFQILNSES